MTLTELKYVVTVEQELHFGRAAKVCLVSQPTLSVAIQKLENELNLQIFDRTCGNITVTPFGAVIIAQAKKVLQEAENLKEIARRMALINDPITII
jgi:LysR family transcriptional regulator, hydrogen peroxide-inducible genes activator